MNVEVRTTHAGADLKAGEGVAEDKVVRVGLDVRFRELLGEVERPLCMTLMSSVSFTRVKRLLIQYWFNQWGW